MAPVNAKKVFFVDKTGDERRCLGCNGNGERCNNTFNAVRWRMGIDIIRNASRGKLSVDDVKISLKDAAPYMLCLKNHSTQKDLLADVWLNNWLFDSNRKRPRGGGLPGKAVGIH